MLTKQEPKKQVTKQSPGPTQVKGQREGGIVHPRISPDAIHFLQRYLGNRYLQSAAEQIPVVSKRITPGNVQTIQRKCACGGTPGPDGECAECRRKRLALQRQAKDEELVPVVPPIVYNVLNTPGMPLDPAIRAFMEPRFGHDFSRVRVHTDGKATESARAVGAGAYTVGHRIVFDAARYAPATTEGKSLIAHELTHVVQQESAPTSPRLMPLGEPDNLFEVEAERVSREVMHDQRGTVRLATPVQRQLITPLGQGGGFGGLMERDRQAAVALARSRYQVCARDLQGVLGLIGNHAYINAPPQRYAIITPLCGTEGDDLVFGTTTAQKWDNSPDPCGKAPRCVPCDPAPGVTDVGACLRSAFTAYASLSLYRATGPNSNTFAGTLARTCCAGMVPKPAILGNVPGWNDPPAPARAGASPCPQGPEC